MADAVPNVGVPVAVHLTEDVTVTRGLQFVAGPPRVALLVVNQREIAQRPRDPRAIADLAPQLQRLAVILEGAIELSLVVIDIAKVAERSRDPVVASELTAQHEGPIEIRQRPVEVADAVVDDADVVQ